MKTLYEPNTEQELLIIKSILDAEGVTYHVTNDGFGSMYTGPVLGLLNAKAVMVDEADYERASELIDEMMASAKEDREAGEIDAEYFADNEAETSPPEPIEGCSPEPCPRVPGGLIFSKLLNLIDFLLTGQRKNS